MIKSLLFLSRNQKILLMIFLDILIVPISLMLSFSFRLEEFYKPEDQILILIISSPLIAIPIFYIFELYNSIIRFINLQFIWVMTKCVCVYSVSVGAIILLLGLQGVPRSIIIINGLICLIFIITSRLISKNIIYIYSENRISNKHSIKNILIYGAGNAGIQLSNAFSFSKEINISGFIDDNLSIQSKMINGIKVYSPSKITNIIKKNRIDEVLIAIPSASRSRRKEIISSLDHLEIPVRILPGLSALALGTAKVEDLRKVNIEDLLGRNSVEPDIELIKKNISNKVVLVTGAAGSIGSEICKKIIKLNPDKLIILDNSEYFLYLILNQLEKEIQQEVNQIDIIPVLGSVSDFNRIKLVCNTHKVQTIYHAAAYKHVPLLEKNKIEGIRNNIFGTLNCVQAAISENVETFVLISTDKAVRPSSVMGISKRYSEIILQSLSQNTNIKTRLIAVRFGNVLGSNGSVIPLFNQQISEGGPITVTHKDVTRYFMTISEASELVIQAGSMGTGGEIFLLNMGDPISILSLAKKMIKLSGLDIKNKKENMEGDIEIKFTGLREGEKLHEELLIESNSKSTEHDMIMSTKDSILDWKDLENNINEINIHIENNNEKELLNSLKEIVRNSII